MVKTIQEKILENLIVASKGTNTLSAKIDKSGKEVIESLTAAQSTSETTGSVTVVAGVSGEGSETVVTGAGSETVVTGETGETAVTGVSGSGEKIILQE